MDSLMLLMFLSMVPLLASQELSTWCKNDDNYTGDATYGSNLNNVLSTITSNNQINYGFYNFSAGSAPDEVYAIAICRGDVTQSVCKSCLSSSTANLTSKCPNSKVAIGWYTNCMLRYSDKDIFGVLYQSVIYLKNVSNVSVIDQFSQTRRNLLGGLNNEASAGDSRKKFATGEASVLDFLQVYGLVQCTPDLSQLDCFNCLSQMINEIPNCCDGSQGATLLQPSCFLRYETYKFYDSASSPTTKGGSNKTTTIIILAVVGTIVSLSLVTLICCCVRRRRKNTFVKLESKSSSKDPLPVLIPTVEDSEIRNPEALQFDFETIRAATWDFSLANKLGQGGFGVVYKGKLLNGQEIAVKRLGKNSGQGEIEFKNEVLLVAKLQHRNLVRLLGFSLEAEERILVYEFMPNSSLDHFLFEEKKRAVLDWKKRYRIIVGIARGLLYLHEDSRLRIIHRDLKASNILLDAEMDPKISDFGMARLFNVDQTHADTRRIVGTYGYMAPEYALHGLFSVKSDVFSYGVLLLEIISGQRNSAFRILDSVEDLLTLVWRKWRDGEALSILDPMLSGSPTAVIMRCLHIALLCVQEYEVDRPTMSSVVVMLSSYSLNLPMPSQPAYVARSGVSSATHSADQSSWATEVDRRGNEPQNMVDDEPLSEFHPR